MKIDLINFTKDAMELLILAKNTRLKMNPDLIEKIYSMTNEEKEKELSYIFGTVGSGWEFVDYVFLIQDVTRAFTHQLVRHRVGTSFAQQTMRAIDESDFDYLSTGKCKDDLGYLLGMDNIKEAYREMLSKGIQPQDARGILPTNILTNILFKINLRALSDMVAKRLCYRTQGEFQDVAKEIVKKVIEVHPWAEKVLEVSCVKDLHCPWDNFRDCPVKKEFNILDSKEPGIIEFKKQIKKYKDSLGTLEFQSKEQK